MSSNVGSQSVMWNILGSVLGVKPYPDMNTMTVFSSISLSFRALTTCPTAWSMAVAIPRYFLRLVFLTPEYIAWYSAGTCKGVCTDWNARYRNRGSFDFLWLVIILA